MSQVTTSDAGARAATGTASGSPAPHGGHLSYAGHLPPLTPEEQRRHVTHTIARLILGAFIFTFIIARILVIFIMSGSLPAGLFFHVSGTHVHHLNYGIFMLSIVGGCLLYFRPAGRLLNIFSVFYGIGLGLTFDEFGMWLHLGGAYWQRASFDAVIVIAAILVLIAYGSTIRHWHPKHHITIVFLVLAVLALGGSMYYAYHTFGDRVGTMLDQLEDNGPT